MIESRATPCAKISAHDMKRPASHQDWVAMSIPKGRIPSPDMDIFPRKILELIIGPLELDTLLYLRLVLKGVSATATLTLIERSFKTRKVSIALRSLEVLTKIYSVLH
jgi:hypothetical protein